MLLYHLGIGAGSTGDDLSPTLRYTLEGAGAAGAAVVRDRRPDLPRDRPAAARPARLRASTWPRSCTGRSRSPCTRPLPTSGTATLRTRVSDVWDKGKAAVIWQEGAATGPDGEELWTVRSSIFVRGEGGWGGDRGTSEKVELPDRTPDADTTYDVVSAAGAALPALRRPQPAARRPRLREGRRLPRADPARAVLLRHRPAPPHRRAARRGRDPGRRLHRPVRRRGVPRGDHPGAGVAGGRPDRRLGHRRQRGRAGRRPGPRRLRADLDVDVVVLLEERDQLLVGRLPTPLGDLHQALEVGLPRRSGREQDQQRGRLP